MGVKRAWTGFRDGLHRAHQTQPLPLPLKPDHPLRGLCPAGVDIPGYVALVADGRYADAVQLIRKDNPLPHCLRAACASIPARTRCRRSMMDDAINIRGLKQYRRGQTPAIGARPRLRCPPPARRSPSLAAAPAACPPPTTSSSWATRSPSSSSRSSWAACCATASPATASPGSGCDEDIAAILSAGDRGRSCRPPWARTSHRWMPLRSEYDAVYVAIGAQTRQEGRHRAARTAEGVISAVEMLRGDRRRAACPTSPARTSCVIGGGNVAMDVHPQRHSPAAPSRFRMRLPPPSGGHDGAARGGGGRRRRGR